MASRSILAEQWRELVREVQTAAPLRPELLGWEPEEIILTAGCDARPHEAIHCERLLAVFPDARITDRREVAHNRISVPGDGSLDRLARGKRTLVLGAIRNPVSRNCDPETSAGTLCAPYYAVHPAWFCFYDCAYCYLSGSPGVRFSPTVRLFTNLQDILAGMAAVLDRARDPVSFYVGKVQDGLQLDPVGNFSRALIPFALHHSNAHLVFLTKSAAVDGPLEAWRTHGQGAAGRVALSWSVNPAGIAEEYDRGAPSLQERLAAASKCALGGLQVRFVFMPLLPVDGWRDLYDECAAEVMGTARASRVTIGGICSYPGALGDACRRLGAGNILDTHATARHGRRLRYEVGLRGEMYRHLIGCLRRYGPRVPVSLCLESAEGWRVAGLDSNACTCILY